MIIDQEPIRQAATQAYRAAGERLATVRATVEKFSTLDEPAYGNWLAKHFGKLLTDLREIEAKIDDNDRLLDSVEMLTMLGRFGPREAYEAALKGKEAAEQFAAKRAANSGAGDEDEVESDEFFDEDKAFNEMFGEFAKMFGFKVPPGQAGRGQPPPRQPEFDMGEEDDSRTNQRPGRRASARAGAARGARDETSSGQRLKAAYRAVVRRLHPDLNPQVTEYGKQLWYDAQSAYEKGDLDRLESILAVSELEIGGELPPGSGIGGVVELTRQVELSITQVERQMRSLKKHPAWNFSALPSKKALEQKTRTRLERDVKSARTELGMLEAELEYYKNAPPRRPLQPRKMNVRKPAGKKKK